jgi:hypothetical protein
MRVRPTYGALLEGSARRSLDDSHEQHVLDGPDGPVVWVERPHHPPDVARGECLLGPVSVVLEGGEAGPDRGPLALFDLDPPGRLAAAGVSASLLASGAEGRLMWDGRRAAVLGAAEGFDPLRAELREGAGDGGRPRPHAAPRLRPRGRRAQPLAFPARTRRRVEYERGLRRLAPRLADASAQLRSWGAVDTAAAIDGLLVEIAAPRSGLSRPDQADAVAIAEDRIGRLAAVLSAPGSAPPQVPALVEAAADVYVAALAGSEKTIPRAFAFFGSSLRLHVPVEREGFVELPASFAESLGAWPLAALPLAQHGLDPLGLRAPSAEELAARCLQLAGDQFRYAVERLGVGDATRERELVVAVREIPAPSAAELPEPIRRIAALVGAAEAGEGYVNETELMLLLAAQRGRPTP